MPIISLIAAIDEANGLGINNQLLTHLPADLQYFKQVTLGKPIIMGRRTYESIGKVLPGRTNIILSKKNISIKDAIVLDSLQSAIDSVINQPEIMIIGGEQLFNQAIANANRLYITKIHHHFNADVFFPQIDKKIWQCKSEYFRAKDTKNVYDITFYVFEK